MRPPVVSRLLVVLLASTFVAACGGIEEEPSCPAPPPTPTRAPGLSGRIVFSGHVGGVESCLGLFVMNADGSGLRRLTEPHVAYFESKWSPDGRSVIFTGDCGDDDGLHICAINADGTGLRRMVSGPLAGEPAWAPDGTRIAFSRSGNDGQGGDIYVVGRHGTGERQVTNDPGDEGAPSWSPDGRSIAFDAKRGGTRQIYVVGAEGGDARLLAPGAGNSESPTWSHDGRRIAFHSDRSAKPESDYTTELRQQPGGELLPPSLPSPDIYVMDVDGQDVVRITDDASANYSPEWSPDDRHIAFVSDRDGKQQVYVMVADGTRQTRLTTGLGESPSWTP